MDIGELFFVDDVMIRLHPTPTKFWNSFFYEYVLFRMK